MMNKVKMEQVVPQYHNTLYDNENKGRQ